MNETTLWRLPTVKQEQGNRSRSALYNDVRDGLLTTPVKLGGNAVAWPALEVQRINAARIAGKTDDEIRSLVRELHEARKALA